MENKLLSRKEVPVELTWDLTAIYPNDEAMLKDMEKMVGMADEIAAKYKGKLADATTINKCVDDYRAFIQIWSAVSTYCELYVASDYYDTNAQQNAARFGATAAECNAKLAFIENEIAEADSEVIRSAADASHENGEYLKEILRNKPHRLSPDTEEALKSLSQVMGTPYEIYQTAKLADMKFDDFEVDGVKYPLGYSLFEDDYQYDARTDVRRAAFNAFSAKIRQYENTTAAAYNAHVQQEKALSKLRGFDSVFDYLLFEQKVDRELYDRQIDLITTKLSVHMRKYAKLLQRMYKLDKMTFADLKLPLDAEFTPRVTVEESHDYIRKGLSVLGEEYGQMIDRAYEERWVDFAKNKGKSTGGFCAAVYDLHAYILLSWNSRMSDVLTLSHELGHAGNFMYGNQHQSILNCFPTHYCGEAPSTMNELIMAHYLIKTNEDKRFRRWVLSCMVGNTYYHNFVTHLLEAAYQREVYKIVDEGGSVNAPMLSAIKRKVLEDFWGDAVEIIDGAELTWMRQPHYYMGLYSYTYSAGLTIATEVCNRIETEGQPAVDDWKKVLGAGSGLTPVEFAQAAGVDITTEKPLLHTIETIGEMIDEMIRLTDEIEAEQ